MFLLSFVKGVQIHGEGGGKNLQADMDSGGPRGYGPGGLYPLADLDRGSNSRGVQIRQDTGMSLEMVYLLKH